MLIRCGMRSVDTIKVVNKDTKEDRKGMALPSEFSRERRKVCGKLTRWRCSTLSEAVQADDARNANVCL